MNGGADRKLGTGLLEMLGFRAGCPQSPCPLPLVPSAAPQGVRPKGFCILCRTRAPALSREPICSEFWGA